MTKCTKNYVDFFFVSKIYIFYLNRATWFTRNHVSGYSVGQCDSFVQEIYNRFHAVAARRKGREEDVEECCQEGNWNGYDDEHEEPDHRPAPLQTHDGTISPGVQ